MAKKQFVIGIDGGGTKTAALLSDLNGNVLVEETGGPSNFQIIGVQKASEVIVSLVKKCCEEIGCSPSEILTIVAGLTGAGREGDKERMKLAVLEEARKQKTAISNVIIESDGRIALEGAFRGKPGIILIAGTGSFALAKDHKGGIHRAGGWGRILGDEGSGYVIGRDGLNAVTKHLDGRGKETLLTRLIAERLGLGNQEAIITAVYRENFDIARVAPLVIEAAEAKDTEAARILNKHTFELFEHVRTLVNKIEESTRMRAKIPLSFIGSVIGAESVYKKILQHKIVFSLPQVTVVAPQASPAFGAVLLAAQSVKSAHE
ncbi:MAG: BadF/BadG/BcrA/BcrD ATPase family protein [Bacteroidota bacterium]